MKLGHRPQTGGRRIAGPRTRPGLLVAALAAQGLAAAGRAFAEEAPPALADQTVEIIGTTALPGAGTPLNQVPGNVQTLRGGSASSQRASNLSEALNQSAGSVNINDTAGNPFQHDVNFRGFTASPALGTPQGLSVFVDGVRVNEVFGDTVNWDLIPDAAIAKITVLPGSDPVFGLNTLGGALNVTTRSGFSDPGFAVQALGGSFGRSAAEFEAGGHGQVFDYFVTGNSLRESGWGEHNPSQVRQLFAKTGYHDGQTDIDLSATFVNSRLEGNQTLPLSFLGDPRQAYTWPDYQTNRMAFFNLKAARHLSDTLLLEGNVYLRRVDTFVLNSNISNDFDPTQPAGPGNQPTGNVINQINQFRPGATLQLSSLAPLAGHGNQLILGASIDDGRTEFTQASQEAGSSRDTSSNEPISLDTSLRSTATASGLYFSDNFSLNDRSFLTLAGRFNHATVDLHDQLGTALNGSHRFNRLNPAAGITYNPTPTLTTYASFSQGMRVPTPVELSCADPEAPCSLPNAFAADPALKAVLSETVEIGGRGRIGPALRWSAAVFDTELTNDIQFISSGGGATSAGYFQNVGTTRRRGLELGLNGRIAEFQLSANYSWIDASFRTPLLLNSPSNSSAEAISCAACSDIQVRPGDRIPGIPHQILKLRLDWDFDRGAAIGMNLLAQSSQYARGDENNRDLNGPVPGFATLSLDASCPLGAGWQLFARVDNVFDRRYSTFGVLGQNVLTGPGNSFDTTGAGWRNEQFRSVGSPRGAWVGLRWSFGRE